MKPWRSAASFIRVAAAKLAASCVQPWSMQTSGTAIPGSRFAGAWTSVRRVRPATIDVVSASGEGRSPARSITARFDAYSSCQSTVLIRVLYQSVAWESVQRAVAPP